MNALLAYPQHPDNFWSFNHALRFIGKKSALPPLGLLTVAALLPESWNLEFVDLNVSPLKDEDILWSDIVLISAISIQKPFVQKLISRCAKLQRKVVAGGPLFTSEPHLFPEIDHLVLNEAEITLPLFLHDLEKGQAKRVYESDERADINTTPTPRWDLINFKHYASLSVQYSRGCPYDCEFCDIMALYGRIPRTKSADRVLLELDALDKRGWHGNVFFVDDNFIGNKKKIKRDLLPAIANWLKDHKYPFRFYTQSSINLADDDDLIAAMTKAGFHTVFVGIETPNKESLIECGKMQNTKCNLLDSVKKLHAAGIQVQAGFIVGFDNDKLDIFSRVSRFIEESGIVTSMVGMLNALPGTKLYDRLKKENRLSKEGSGNNTDFSTNFVPKMDYKVLVDGYKKLVTEIYKPDIYYKRVKSFLRNYKRHYKVKKVFKIKRLFPQLRPLFMSFYKLGIRKGVRRHFWKLIVWTSIRKPRLLPLAITLSIYGQHFNKYFESVVH